MSRLPRTLFVLLVAFLLSMGSARSQVVAYHDVSSAVHQANTTNLKGQGYRITSLSVAGGLSAPRYSAVWEHQVFGPLWVSGQDMSLGQYTAARSTWMALGYRAKLITGAGSGSNTVLAAVFVADGVPVQDFHNHSEATFLFQVDVNRAAGRIPVSVDIHGTSGNPLYCAVFEPNTNDTVWGCDIAATPAEFTAARVAHFQGGERPACIGMSESHRYVAVWYDDRVGTWACLNDNTSAGYQTVFTSFFGNGYYPRIVASGGSGTSLRITGSFAQHRTPLAPALTVTGTHRSVFDVFDTYMTNLVQNNRARGAALAIAREGKLVYARGFTNAEPGYPIVQPTTSFRIASCSKPITAIATHEADERGYLSMTTSPASALGLSYSDPLFANIDLQDVLSYSSGILRNYGAGPIASWQNPSSPTMPVGLTLASQWLAQQPMLFAPGTADSYSNAAFLLAAEVIRVRTGQTYQNFLQSTVLAPLGITRIRVAPSEYAQHLLTDARSHLNELGLRGSERYTDRRLVSVQHALDMNLYQTSGGMASSAVDFVRLLSGVFDLKGADAIVLGGTTVQNVLAHLSYPQHSDPTESSSVCLGSMAWEARPNGVYAYSKGGTLECSSATVCWRTDGISWAIFVNKGNSHANKDSVNSRIEGITDWPNVDEFPTYGLPAFPQRPEITVMLPTSLPSVTNGSFTLIGKRLDTVTRIDLGSHQITSTSPSDWEHGYFTVTSPERIEVYPPQGLAPQGFWLWALNATGTSGPVSGSITPPLTFRVAAPTVVQPDQTWSTWVSRGSVSGLSPTTFAILVLSFSGQPSSAPGIVELGICNGFTDLIMSDAVMFSPNTNLAQFSIPALPIGGIWVQAVAVDLEAPDIFPLPASNFRHVQRP